MAEQIIHQLGSRGYSVEAIVEHEEVQRLATARLRVESYCVRLEVASAARAPDSEVVMDRLRWLASAIGAGRAEIVVRDRASPL